MALKTKKKSQWRSRPEGIIAALMTAFMVLLGLVNSPVQEAYAANGPNPYVISTLTKTYDGTGFVDGKPSPASSFINGKNGFYPGDNGPDDGNVTSNDTVGYF